MRESYRCRIGKERNPLETKFAGKDIEFPLWLHSVGFSSRMKTAVAIRHYFSIFSTVFRLQLYISTIV